VEGRIVITVAGAAGGAQAQANQRGEIIAYSCSGCHGHDFKGSGGVPLLRGRNADELSQMMTEFRAGQRYSTVMRRLALGLDEADMRAVSDYLAGLR
jgi:sulfide dehydrogenase cytochrome subunit